MSGQTFFDKTAFWDEQRFQGLELERARRVVDFLPPDTTSAVDVGCGNGLITHLIPKDIPAAGLDLSQAALSHLRVPAVRGSATHLPFGANAFDALICAEMLEHIPFPDFPIALTELARVARRSILISVPFCENLRLVGAACPKCGCVFHIFHHVRSFDQKTLTHLFPAQTGFTLTNIQLILPEAMPVFLGLVRKFSLLPFPAHTLCPQCGYFLPDAPAAPPKTNRWLTLVKALWPTYQRPRWWVALYQKRS